MNTLDSDYRELDSVITTNLYLAVEGTADYPSLRGSQILPLVNPITNAL
jgi:hypothetical protein